MGAVDQGTVDKQEAVRHTFFSYFCLWLVNPASKDVSWPPLKARDEDIY
jgi:hypothetical protein